MRRASKKTFLTLVAWLAAAQHSLLQAQTPVAPTFQGAVNDIRTIAIAAGTLVAGMVGLIGLGVAATLLGYGVCFLMDNTDRLESDSASFLRRELNSQSLSAQRLRIFDREAV